MDDHEYYWFRYAFKGDEYTQLTRANKFITRVQESGFEFKFIKIRMGGYWCVEVRTPIDMERETTKSIIRLYSGDSDFIDGGLATSN